MLAIEIEQLSLADILDVLGLPPVLTRRTALHFMQQGLLRPNQVHEKALGRKRYAYPDLLRFAIATWLAVGMRVPVPLIKQVLGELHRKGYFLLPEEVREIKALRNQDVHPEKLREILRERYRLPIPAGVSYRSGVEVGEQSVWSSPDDRHPRRTIQYLISKSTTLARISPRPWPFCLLLRPGDKKDDLRFSTIMIPPWKDGEDAEDSVHETGEEELHQRFHQLALKHPLTLVLNLCQLETAVRRRCAVLRGEAVELENQDEPIEEF